MNKTEALYKQVKAASDIQLDNSCELPIALHLACIAYVPPAGVNRWGHQPRRSRVVCAAKAPGSAVGVQGGAPVHSPPIGWQHRR